MSTRLCCLAFFAGGACWDDLLRIEDGSGLLMKGGILGNLDPILRVRQKVWLCRVLIKAFTGYVDGCMPGAERKLLHCAP